MSSNIVVLNDMLKSHLKEKIDNNDRSYDYFHPSEFHECIRKIGYKYYKVPSKSDITPDLQKIFDNGHYFHDRYTEYLTGMGVLQGVWECANPNCGTEFGRDELRGIEKPEVPCDECGCEKYIYNEVTVANKEYWLKGHVDGIFKMSGKLFVIDYKSMNSRMFSKLAAPLDKHVLQISIYLYLLDIDSGFLLYENKDTQRNKIYEINRNKNFEEKILSRAEKLIAILEAGKIPSRPFDKDSSQCKKCQFKKVCWAKKEK
jgi:CRISPR/Cas system-associated exonuclease Cas4 (RecB family)